VVQKFTESRFGISKFGIPERECCLLVVLNLVSSTPSNRDSESHVCGDRLYRFSTFLLMRSAPRAISEAGRASNIVGGALQGRQGRAAQLRTRENLIARQGIWIAILCMLQGTPLRAGGAV